MGKRKVIIAIIVLAAAAVLGTAGYFYWKSRKAAQAPSAETSLESAIQAGSAVASSATQGVLPSIGDAINPLGDKPDLNPADKANPFKSIKTNPFQ